MHRKSKFGIRRKTGMFDRYMIVEDGLRNVFEGEEAIGFELGIRIPYYRGVALSLVEDIVVAVDGKKCPRDAIRFTVASGSFTLAEMETCVSHRWQFGEVARLTIRRAGGLAPGEHEITLTEDLRISYMPVPSITTSTKILKLAA
jgi:hypothetical protein